MTLSEKTRTNLSIATQIAIIGAVIGIVFYATSIYSNLDFRVKTLEDYKTNEERIWEEVTKKLDDISIFMAKTDTTLEWIKKNINN